jgi:hypothetical protein
MMEASRDVYNGMRCSRGVRSRLDCGVRNRKEQLLNAVEGARGVLQGKNISEWNMLSVP